MDDLAEELPGALGARVVKDFLGRDGHGVPFDGISRTYYAASAGLAAVGVPLVTSPKREIPYQRMSIPYAILDMSVSVRCGGFS